MSTIRTVNVADLVSQATAHAKTREFKQAEHLAREALEADRRSPEAYNVLGIALAGTGSTRSAIDAFQQAHDLSPAQYPYARNLVNLLCTTGAFDRARELAQRFAANSPDPVAAGDLLGYVERAEGTRPARATEVFDEIYRRNAWNAGSGLGSLEASTRAYREFLQSFLALNQITSVVDLGCGDWQFSRYIDWSGIRYLGIDASALALERARGLAPPSCSFRMLDAITEPLPPADLLIVKDVLQHWPNAAVSHFIGKLGAFDRALITNSFGRGGQANADIRMGSFRPLDLTAEPFSLSGTYVLDFQADDRKATLLWAKSDGSGLRAGGS